MKTIKVGQRVRINAKDVSSRFGIIKENFYGMDAYFVKVGCKEDRIQHWIGENGKALKSCILLGASYLTVIE